MVEGAYVSNEEEEIPSITDGYRIYTYITSSFDAELTVSADTYIGH